MLGIGTVYKVRPGSPSHWLYIGWLTPYLLGVQPCSMHGFVDHPMSAAVHHRSLPHYYLFLMHFAGMQAACAGLTLVGAFFIYNMAKGKSLDQAAGDFKVRITSCYMLHYSLNLLCGQRCCALE